MPKGKYIAGRGSVNAKLMIVGEAPGAVEESLGKPFAGPTGEVLDKMLEHCKFDYDAAYITNVVKYRPPDNDFYRLREIDVDLEKSISELWEEIRAIAPTCILALGEQALRACTDKRGISSWRGSILLGRDGQTKVVATYHPANLLHSNDGPEAGRGVFKYSYKYVIRHDIQRAIDQSRFAELRLPERALEVCKSSMQFQRFLDRQDLNNPCSIDIEAYKCIPNTIALAFSAKEAISIPLYNKMSCLNFEGIALHDLAYIWKDLADLLRNPQVKVIGQNFKYDHDKIERLGFRIANIYGDTMILAHVINPEIPEKNLAFLASIFTEEPFWKLEGKEFDPRKDSFDRLLLYNAKDAAVTYEVHEEMLKVADTLGLRENYFDCYVPRHRFYLSMERTGFRVDAQKQKTLLDKYMLLYETVHDRITTNFGRELNVNSPKQMKEAVYGDLGLPRRFKLVRNPKTGQKIRVLSCDEETLIALMANNAKSERAKTILSDVLEERKIRRTISNVILAKPDYDGRMRTAYNLVGTETDRTSTSNISSPVRPEKSMGLPFQTITKHGEIGSDVGEMFVPDEGYVFINADLSQAEARVVFVLAEEWETLALLDDPAYDIHWDTAKLFFKELPSVETCKLSLDKDDMRRFMGKTCRHAGHLGMKKHTFMMNVNTDSKKYGYDLKISEYTANIYLEAFHAKNPKIRSVFHKGIENALNATRILEGPLLYKPNFEKMKRGRWRQFYDRFSNELIKEACSEIPQATISNQTKNAGMRIAKRLPKLEFILEGHDALLVQAKIEDVEKVIPVMREELERPIDFRYGTFKRDYELIVPADFQIGAIDYKNLTKYKNWQKGRAECKGQVELDAPQMSQLAQ